MCVVVDEAPTLQPAMFSQRPRISVGPFELIGAFDERHVAVLRGLIRREFPWHGLLSADHRAVRIVVGENAVGGVFYRQTAMISMGVEPGIGIGRVMAHEIGHAIDMVFDFGANYRRLIHRWLHGGDAAADDHLVDGEDQVPDPVEGWLPLEPHGWDTRRNPHSARPSEAFANWFASYMGHYSWSHYGSFHTWHGRARDAIAELVTEAADDIQIFADVPLDHPNRRPIEWAAGKGVVRGFPDGTFRPRDAVTRGQLTTILHNRKAAA